MTKQSAGSKFLTTEFDRLLKVLEADNCQHNVTDTELISRDNSNHCVSVAGILHIIYKATTNAADLRKRTAGITDGGELFAAIKHGAE